MPLERRCTGEANRSLNITRQTGVERFYQLAMLGMWWSGVCAIASSTLPIDVYLLVAAGSIAVRLGLILADKKLPLRPGLIDLISVLYAVLYPYDLFQGSKDFVIATVHLVLSVGSLRLISAATDRDYFFVKILSFLALVSAALVSANATFVLCFIVQVGFSVATFSSHEIRKAGRKPRIAGVHSYQGISRRLCMQAGFVTVGILGVAFLLFFILPRTARAAMSRFIPEGMHITGFSNEVKLGAIGQLQQRQTLMFHARLGASSVPIDGRRLKWRGAALSQFDGKRWWNRDRQQELLKLEHRLLRTGNQVHEGRPGRRFHYEVQLAGISSDALFFAGSPEFINVPAPFLYRVNGNNYRLPSATWERIRYEADTFLDDEEADGSLRLSEEERQAHLELPVLDGRIWQLARQATGEVHSSLAQARQIEQFLRKNYSYTLELPKVEATDPVAQFLFERKQGHCEYFASTMAVMLRINGIPSRVVTGFLGGQLNPVSGWYLVRASNAHSWVEAWFSGRGWIAFDPTPNSTGIAAAPFWRHWANYLDATELLWQDWVMNFDSDRQSNLAYRLEMASRSLALPSFKVPNFSKPAWPSWGLPVIGFVLLICFLPFLRHMYLAGGQRRRVLRGGAWESDAAGIYLEILRLLERRGWRRDLHQTPLEFSRTLPDAGVVAEVETATREYNHFRFGGDAESGARLLAHVDRLQKLLKVR